jgi:hypothetical protein
MLTCMALAGVGGFVLVSMNSLLLLASPSQSSTLSHQQWDQFKRNFAICEKIL